MDKQTLEKINNINKVIFSSTNFDDVLAVINREARELLGTERVTIYATDDETADENGNPTEIYSRIRTVEKEGDTVDESTQKGSVGPNDIEIRVPIDETSISGYVAKSGQTVCIEDVNDTIEIKKIHPNLQFDSKWGEKEGFYTRNMICCPITVAEKTVGVIQAMNKQTSIFFEDDDREIINELSKFIGLAMKNSSETSMLRRQSKPKKPITQILVDNGVIEHNKLQEAMDEADNTGKRLHKLLIEKYEVHEREYARCLAEYNNKKFFEYTDDLMPDKTLAERVPEKVCKAYNISPLQIYERNGDPALKIVMKNPLDFFIVEDIEIRTGLKVGEIQVGCEEDIKKLIRSIYSEEVEEEPQEEFDEILGEVDGLNVGDSKDVDMVEVEKGAKEDEGPIVKLVNRIIEDAYRQDASDIHIEPFEDKVVVRFRKDGTLEKALTFPLHARKAVVSRIKLMCGLDITERRLPQDGKIKFKEFGRYDIELRVGTLPTVGEDREDIVMRILADSEPIPLDKMGMNDHVFGNLTKMVKQPYGMIFCVGPTGSGKTTTLHSCLGYINEPDIKILTAEDPVEITQVGLRQVQTHKKIGLTFAAVLRQFLRQDPDVIMVGECRDEETSSIAIESALTGHLVFSTLHTNNAPETVTRLLDMGLDPFSFADALLGVLAQRLVKRICKKCKEEYKPTEEECKELDIEYSDELRLFKAEGCDKCKDGYKGRMGLHELLVNTDEMKQFIMRRAKISEMFELAAKNGMRTLYEDGIQKALSGATTVQEVRRVCIQ